jgi:hypothetical protein
MSDRETLSFPTISLPGETRTVVNTMDGMISYATWMGEVDKRRMTTDSKRDFIIMPSWSSGKVWTLTLRHNDAVTFAERSDGKLGLNVTTETSEGTSSFDIDGFARVVAAG